MSQVINNSLPTFTSALSSGNQAEAERIVGLAMEVQDGKQANEALILATTEVASAETLVGKLNAINDNQPFTMPVGERLPSNDDAVFEIGFDGENWVVLNDGSMSTWLELKRQANDVYKARHLTDEAIDNTLEQIAQHRESGTMTFTKNTIRALKNGQYAVNLAGRMGQAKKSSKNASSDEVIAHMKSAIANSKK